MDKVSLQELKKVIALRDLPDDHLKWIVDRSEYREYSDGTVLVKTGEPIDYMWIVLEGAASFYMDINGRLIYYYSFENEESTGGVGGVLPYSRMKKSPGYAYAAGTLKALMLHKKYFPELEHLNLEFTQRLIAYMTDRARAFATMQLQQEKVSALGKLAAGIAHELNNPAAAINRIASELSRNLIQNTEIFNRMVSRFMNKEFPGGRVLEKLKEKSSLKLKRQTAVEKMEKEDSVTAWLEENKITSRDFLAETFTESMIELHELDSLKKEVSADDLEDVLLWYGHQLSSQQMISDLSNASERISDLVGAIKSHVHMDRTSDMQQTCIPDDIDNTLTLLGHKLREKNIRTDKIYAEKVPKIDAFVSELNQVWMNIIDNAIYAMDKNGILKIEIFPKNNDLKVCITDNGSGIPPEIISRIFEPFFTTKKVGEGTGIGLDLASRIIKRHRGDIKCVSKPGCTRFEICLPVYQQQPE